MLLLDLEEGVPDAEACRPDHRHIGCDVAKLCNRVRGEAGAAQAVVLQVLVDDAAGADAEEVVPPLSLLMYRSRHSLSEAGGRTGRCCSRAMRPGKRKGGAKGGEVGGRVLLGLCLEAQEHVVHCAVGVGCEEHRHPGGHEGPYNVAYCRSLAGPGHPEDDGVVVRAEDLGGGGGGGGGVQGAAPFGSAAGRRVMGAETEHVLGFEVEEPGILSDEWMDVNREG